ncbi:MAG: PASTA domain-containing protein [Bacteroidales bacterium]|nr:PASTA domain-containing protein [Bacteroidales bacterium]MCF8389290.1 PASTA domain-containing protein [Bacteroidales bacterium]
MEFLKFLISKRFLKNLIIAASLSIVLLSGIFLWLHIFTRHNQTISVPDFSGLTEEEAGIIASSKNLRFEITDSVFYKDLPKGLIAKQNPKPGEKVKQNRRIYLTKNAVNPEKVAMPTVTGVSLRQARTILESNGLVVGKLSYKPDIAMNVVLEQKHNDSLILAGAILPKGSEINLTLGKGLSNETTAVPNLIGFSRFLAKEYLNDRYLNIGGEIYDSSVKNEEDSIASFIWQQRPEFNEEFRLQLGSQVDIFLTIDSTKLPFIDTLVIEGGDDYENLFNE